MDKNLTHLICHCKNKSVKQKKKGEEKKANRLHIIFCFFWVHIKFFYFGETLINAKILSRRQFFVFVHQKSDSDRINPSQTVIKNDRINLS